MLDTRTKPNRCFEAYSRHRPRRRGRSLPESRVPGASGTPGLFTAGVRLRAWRAGCTRRGNALHRPLALRRLRPHLASRDALEHRSRSGPRPRGNAAGRSKRDARNARHHVPERPSAGSTRPSPGSRLVPRASPPRRAPAAFRWLDLLLSIRLARTGRVSPGASSGAATGGSETSGIRLSRRRARGVVSSRGANSGASPRRNRAR